MTPALLPAEPPGEWIADADSHVAVEARHRAPDPLPDEDPCDTTVILSGWATYGRHAAPTSGTREGVSLPALPLRPRTTAAVIRPDIGERQADPDVEPDASAGAAPPDDDTASAPNLTAAPAYEGFVRRCLRPWTAQRGSDLPPPRALRATRRSA